MAQARKPPTDLELVWEHDLVLAGKSSEIKMTLDSDAREGPSPMQALAFALAGCMGMDVVYIIRKGRHDLRGVRAELKGFRAQEAPHRFTRIELRFTVVGNVVREVVERAIQLSREKYCSVWHSMRQDIELDVTFVISEGV